MIDAMHAATAGLVLWQAISPPSPETIVMARSVVKSFVDASQHNFVRGPEVSTDNGETWLPIEGAWPL